jgi:GxxExxY protein
MKCRGERREELISTGKRLLLVTSVTDFSIHTQTKHSPMLHIAAPARHRFVPSSRINLITGKIIGARISVHKNLGSGLLESAYEACVGYELSQLGLSFERQKPVPLIYHNIKLDCDFRADIVVEGKVVVEIKSKEALRPVEHARLLSHMRLLNIHVGLLINFHVMVLKDGITRLVNDYQEESDIEDSTDIRSEP